LILEEHARKSRIGLWKDDKPTPPWQYRKDKRNCGGGKSSVAGGPGIYHGINPVGFLNVGRCPKRTQNLTYIAGHVALNASRINNVKSRVLHGYGCRYYNCKNCTAVFRSVKEALRAGYRVHKGCVK